jgi:hypothetical protein
MEDCRYHFYQQEKSGTIFSISSQITEMDLMEILNPPLTKY